MEERTLNYIKGAEKVFYNIDSIVGYDILCYC